MVRPRGSDTSVFFRETDQPLTKASENFWDYAVALFFAKASAAGAWKVRTISSNIGESGGPGVTFRLRRSPPGKEVRRKDTNRIHSVVVGHEGDSANFSILFQSGFDRSYGLRSLKG